MSPDPRTAVRTVVPVRTPDAPTAFREVHLPELGVPGSVRSQALAAETERARTAGYAAGWAAGARAAAEAAERQQRALAQQAEEDRARHEAAVAEGLAALARAAQTAAARTAPVVEAATREVLDAVVAVAAAVVGHELSDDATSARSVLARVAALPADLGVQTVRVSREDHAAITAVVEGAGAALPPGVELVVDPALGRGDMVAEHPHGFVDGRVRTALERARRALEEVA